MIGPPAQDNVNTITFAGEPVPPVILTGLFDVEEGVPIAGASHVPGEDRAAIVCQGDAKLGEEFISLTSPVEAATGATLQAGMAELRRAAGRLSELLEGSVY